MFVKAHLLASIQAYSRNFKAMKNFTIITICLEKIGANYFIKIDSLR